MAVGTAQPQLSSNPLRAVTEPLSGLWRSIRTLMKSPNGTIGMIGTVFFISMALLGPDLLPKPAFQAGKRALPPSAEHVFGTDFQGKDILTLVVRGGREVVVTALITGGLTTAIAVVLGSLAAYLGGTVDRVITSIGNFILTIPYLVLLSVLAAFIKFDNLYLLGVLMAVLFWPSLMRTIRAQVFSLREREYVEAAQALDLGTAHIIFREILPNMASYIITHLIFAITNAVYSQVALIFLGLVPLDPGNWGIIMFNANKNGAIFNPDNIWWLLAPIQNIALLQWSLVTLARAIEDTFNPRLKTGG